MKVLKSLCPRCLHQGQQATTLAFKRRRPAATATAKAAVAVAFRALTTSSSQKADPLPNNNNHSTPFPPTSTLLNFSSQLRSQVKNEDPSSSSFLLSGSSSRALNGPIRLPPPHHLHVFATKHNCHITLSNGARKPLISVSAGNIGFRKHARGTYDAAYQLGAYVMGRIMQRGLLREIQALELVLRDFGPGREAVTKILMGQEGKALRGRIVRVMDATRLKFGGTRSPRPRRL